MNKKLRSTCKVVVLLMFLAKTKPNFNMKTYGQRAFSVAVPRLWNKLPFEIRACSDVNLFKSKLKTFLFKKVYDI